MAKNTDHFIKAISAPPTKLSNAINDTSTNIFLESLEGIQSDTAVVVVIDRVNGDGVQTPELTEVVIGTVGTNGLENVVRGVGGKQQAHKTGAVVEVSIASSEQWNRLISALLKTHNQDGTLKLGQINNEHLVDGAVDNKKIKLKGINGDRLADNSVDGRVLSSGAVKPEHTNFPRTCYSNATINAQHNNGDIIRLRSKIYDNTADIELLSDSSFKIKKTGVLVLSCNLWIQATAAARPWLTVFRTRGHDSVVVADCISNTPSSYTNLTLANHMITVQANDIIKLTCSVVDGGAFTLDGASGRTNSQVVMEII